MTGKPEQIPATSTVRDSIASKVEAFDADPEAYQGTAALAEPDEKKEETNGTDEDDA